MVKSQDKILMFLVEEGKINYFETYGAFSIARGLRWWWAVGGGRWVEGRVGLHYPTPKSPSLSVSPKLGKGLRKTCKGQSPRTQDY